MKSIIKICLIGIVAMFIASGCGGSSGEKTGKMTIKSVELK